MVICNDGEFEVPESVAAVSVTEGDAAEFGWQVKYADVVASDKDWPEHDPVKLAHVLESVVEQ